MKTRPYLLPPQKEKGQKGGEICPNLELNQEPRHFTMLLVTRSTIEPLGRLIVEHK